ncbi:MAG: porin family protein [Salinibacter sp.]
MSARVRSRLAAIFPKAPCSLPSVLVAVGLALTLLAPLRAPAQGLQVGGRVGPSFGFLNDSPVPFVSEKGVTAARTNVRIDVHAGIHAVLPLDGSFAVQPELLFVRKGGHLSRVGQDLYASERYQLSYFQVHLLGRRDVALPGPLSLRFLAGPTVAVATGGVVRRTLRGRTVALDQRIPLLKHGLVKRWDAGLLLGTGLGYPIGDRATMALELRYNAGVRSVFTEAQRSTAERGTTRSDPPPLTDTPPPLRHDVIMASLTLTVPLGAP